MRNMRNVQQLLHGDSKEWYETHKNTAALLQATVAALDLEKVSGEEIWQLMRLTWITKNVHGVSPNHWQTLKIPALSSVFGRSDELHEDLPSTIRSMRLPSEVASAAILETGAVNFRPVWRNAARHWCKDNTHALRRIIHAATRRRMSTEQRIELATLIAELPGIPSPNKKVSARALLAFSPLAALLDPQSRFPIINGRSEVNQLLKALGLTNRGVEDQVRHLTGLIGQFGIKDSFLLDIFAKEIGKLATAAERLPIGTDLKREMNLPAYDLAERLAAQKATTVVYRNRHNKMTEALRRLFCGYELVTRYSHDCNYDVKIRNYDRTSRDLLIEAKPDPEKGAIRIAIGQLLDYRRFIERPAATDLAVLTILPPSDSHIELLDELQITALWYTDETCRQLDGAGRAWPAIRDLQR